ncbi:AaceriAEL245Wp [[Ashbya] aceris (nom. inval.)]|nr:AaceriAEL245Wp [[Ashbya] aceris (nom. inval.)]
MDTINLSTNLHDWLEDPMLQVSGSRGAGSVGTGTTLPSPGMKHLELSQNNPTPSPRSSVSMNRDSRRKSGLYELVQRVPLDGNSLLAYVLQQYFHVHEKKEAELLTLVDIILDQTYPHSLTLRKLRYDSTYFRYFGTISRENDIAKCPVFYVSLYFYMTWGLPAGKQISWDTFSTVPLFSRSPGDEYGTITSSSKPESQNHSMSNKITRSVVVPAQLKQCVYPWLGQLKDDMNQKDRVNYKLYSLIELFQYLSECIVQDIAFLECTDQLPTVQELVRESNPKLFGSAMFAKYKEDMRQQLDGEVVNKDWHNSILLRMEEKFNQLTAKTAQDNTKLNTEISDLKGKLNSMNTMLSQLLDAQRQLISKSSHVPLPSATGVPSLDKNIQQPISLSDPTAALAPISVLPSLSHQHLTDGKRKLPLPSAPSPLDHSAGATLKKFRFEDRVLEGTGGTPNNIGSPLESLLSRAISSPRIPITSLTTQVPATLAAATPPLHVRPQNTRILQEPRPVVDSTAASMTLPQDCMNNIIADEPELQKAPLADPVPTLSVNTTSSTGGPNESIKYKLSRDNKTIWDLYTEWYTGFDGKPSIKSLIERYGWRRWKVSEDSHFFPTRRIIINYIEKECDRGVAMGKYPSTLEREAVRKLVVKDLENFRVNNGLTLNSLSLYFRNLTREQREICIYNNFTDWSLLILPEEEKRKYCKRKQGTSSE